MRKHDKRANKCRTHAQSCWYIICIKSLLTNKKCMTNLCQSFLLFLIYFHFSTCVFVCDGLFKYPQGPIHPNNHWKEVWKTSLIIRTFALTKPLRGRLSCSEQATSIQMRLSQFVVVPPLTLQLSHGTKLEIRQRLIMECGCNNVYAYRPVISGSRLTQTKLPVNDMSQRQWREMVAAHVTWKGIGR